MSRVNSAFLALLLTVFLGLATHSAQAQSYVFGTASFPAPSVTSTSPPFGNPPIIPADFNGDGITDFAILGPTSGTQGVSILMGTAGGSFAPAVNYPVEADGMAVGDFNGDGKLDIITVSRTYFPVATILLGNGDGTFQSPATLDLGISNAQYSFAAAADFNGDGKLDLVLLTPNFATSATMAILLGNGDGTFAAPVTYTVPVAPYLSVGDFNGDGRPDIAIAGPNYTSGQPNLIVVLINSGNGTFQSPVQYSLTGVIESLAIADLNRDGKLDLIVPTGGQSASVNALLGIGDGTFASPVTETSNLLNIYGSSVTVADFNGDGEPDVAVNSNSYSLGTYGIAILFGNGDGTLQSPPSLYSAGQGGVPIALDVNGDGKPDLVVWGTSLLTAIINQGNGIFPAHSSYLLPQYPYSAVVGDFNGDGKPDVVVTIFNNPGFASVFLGNGDGTFQPHQDIQVEPDPNLMAAGDFNNDGHLDLIVAGSFTPTTEGFYNLPGNGDGTFQTPILEPTSSFVRSLVVADFNHDGNLDVAAVIDGTNAVSIFLGTGTGTFSVPVQYPTGPMLGSPPIHNVLVGDFNQDGILDLVVSTDAGVSILLGKGDGTFQPYSATLPGAALLAVADSNGDGKLDLALGENGYNRIAVALGNGDGTFQSAVIYPPLSNIDVQSTVVGDFDRDGKLDIAVSNQGSAGTIILFGNGDGTFRGHIFYATGSPTSLNCLAAGDFNGDGALDLALADTTNTSLYVLLNSAVAAIYPHFLNFGSQPIGTSSAEKTVSVSNPSPVPILFSGISTLGEFSESGACATKLAPGSNCQVNVTFAPVTAGLQSGSLLLNDSAPGSPQTIALSGTGIGPAAAVSFNPSILTFNGQAVGTTSSVISTTLTNTGNATLTITSISASGDFAQTNTCGTKVNAGANCAINVTFAPTTGGSLTGSVTITDNAADSPQIVALSGTGLVSMASLSTTSLTFTGLAVGSTSSPQALTLTNTGGAAMTLAGIAASGDFAQTNNCGSSLAVNAACTINVTFTPTLGGTRTGQITITDNAGDSPQTVALTGTGLTPIANIAPSRLTFSGQYIGSTSDAQAVTLKNTGAAALSVAGIAAGGDFAQTNNCGSSLAVNATCTINVTFTPMAEGSRTGAITLTDNSADSPQSVALTGTGAAFNLIIPSGSSANATVSPGGTANYSLTFSGPTGFTQAVNFTCKGAPSEATCTVNPTSATPGASGTVTIAVAVATTAASAIGPRSPQTPLGPKMPGRFLLLLLFVSLGLACISFGWRRGGNFRWGSVAAAIAILMLTITSCGGGGGGGGPVGPPSNTGTPSGTYTITVTGTAAGSATMGYSVKLTLIVS